MSGPEGAPPGPSRRSLLSRRRLLRWAATTPALLLAGVAFPQATGPKPAGELRIVSIGGGVTEILFRLGAGPQIVGTDTTSLYPEAAQATPKVGYARSLSAEGVLALRPTLLIASAAAGPPAVVAQLRQAGVTLMQADPAHSVEGLLENVRRIAAAIGRPEAGAALVAELEAEWRNVQAAMRVQAPAPRVLFVLSHVPGNVQVAGEETAADALIRLAGGRNAMQGFRGFRPLSAEAALSAAPDFLLTTRQGIEALGGERQLLVQPGLGLTPAGRAGRVLVHDALFLLGGGPRLPRAVAELARQFGTSA